MSHLTLEQRYTVSSMLQAGSTQTAIADVLGKHKSVISREVKRNSDGRSSKYRATLADHKAKKRLKEKAKRILLTDDMKSYISAKLGAKFSPEQIVGRAKKEGVAIVSHERIYQYVWADKRTGGKLHKDLRNQGKKYRNRGASKDRRGLIKDRVDIDLRPKEVEKREHFGDLEIDTIIGKDNRGAILTINDRATGMVKIRKLKGKDALELAAKVEEALKDWKPYLRTITSDNGKEFAAHKVISEALEIDFYFAHPYHSWERGSNENLNGLIRQYIPKRTDFDEITEEFIAFVEKELNNRPRKRFGFQSPLEVFNQKVAFIT
jgi:transposase, IS30 family